jgi:hypothetical protein
VAASVLVVAASSACGGTEAGGAAPPRTSRISTTTSPTIVTTTAIASTTTAVHRAELRQGFAVAPGESGVAGQGRLWRYTVEVEASIDVDVGAFAGEVDAALAAPKGWTADGSVAFQRVSGGSVGFRIRLATPSTTDALCAPLPTNGIYSCRRGDNVVINVRRWQEGAAPSRLSLGDYRVYVVNHEVGHALGHGHVGCPARGVPAPVMMQQTKSIGACSPNPWPFP